MLYILDIHLSPEAMALMVFLVLSVCFAQAAADSKFLKGFCAPDENTTTACFKPLWDLHDPNFLDPHVIGLDGNPTGNITTFKSEAYQLGQFEINPVFMCTHKEEYLSALSCMNAAVKEVCSFLVKDIFGDKEKLDKAYTYICSELKNVKIDCLRGSGGHVRRCMKQMYPHIDWDKDKTGGDSNSTNSTDGSSKGDKKNTGGMGGYRVVDSEQSSKIWAEEEKAMKSDCNWGNVMDKHSAMDLFDMLLCHQRFKLINCVTKTIASCDQYTADVMLNFVKMQESKKCAKLIEGCEAQKPPKCTSKTCGAATCSVGWAAMLLPLLLAMSRMLTEE